MKTHPAAKLFPLMDTPSLEELSKDIKENGLRDALITHPNGSLLDGRNRLKACKKAKVDPRFKKWDGKGSVVAYVVSVNLHRRHLTQSQKACVAVDILPMLAAEAKERQGTRTDTSSKELLDVGQARDKAATIVGTNRQYVSDAKKLKEEAPKVFEQVRSGEKTITEAKREIGEKKREKKRRENAKKVSKAKNPEKITGVFSTIVIDPPWDFKEEGDHDVYGRTRPTYTQMSDAQIEKLPVKKLAADDCHLYLWITNRSLLTGKAWKLCEAWGFRPVTILTWCKPSIGVGNYFRNNTEHVVFAVRGRQSLKVKNAATWFQAKRGKGGHSSKPSSFPGMVEKWSPGPYIDMFSRGKRDGWASWGEDS